MENFGAAHRVVVADDDGDIRQLMEIAVHRAGLDLAAAAPDGAVAWEAIKRVNPAIVVLDVSMPGLTGLELCQLIREDASLRGIRVILLSASAGETSRRAAMDAGADDYLLKPFSPKALAAQLGGSAHNAG